MNKQIKLVEEIRVKPDLLPKCEPVLWPPWPLKSRFEIAVKPEISIIPSISLGVEGRIKREKEIICIVHRYENRCNILILPDSKKRDILI